MVLPLPPQGMAPPAGPPPQPAAMGMPPMGMDPMMGMGMPPMGGMGMPPQGIPGFQPGVMPDPNFPGSAAMEDAALMLAMQDPAVMLSLIRIMLQDSDKDPGPKLPYWYRKEDYDRPTEGDIQTQAQNDRSDHELLIDRMRRDRDRLRAAVVGVFSDFDAEVEETWRDASLALDYMLIVSILAACETLFTKAARKAGQAEEAQEIENLCYAAYDQWGRNHRKMMGTSLKADIIKTFMSTGHLVTRVVPNYHAEEGDVPSFIDLLDPASCFPTYDSYGLYSMTRKYHQPIREVCHGFRLGKDAKKKLKSKKIKDGERFMTDNDPVEVTEYWDRRWYSLIVDNETVIKSVEHGLGHVPFAYTVSSTGDPGNVYEQNLNTFYGGASYNSRQRDLANKGQSHIQFLQIVHEQREAVMGIAATELQKVKNPPRTFEQDPMYYGDSPEINNAPGGISLLHMMQEREVPNQTDGRINMLGPLMSSVTEAAQRGMLSPADHGMMPGSQSSGTVVEGLSESSKDKFNLWKMGTQEHLEVVMELMLTQARDQGRKLGPDGQRGTTLQIEKQFTTQGEDGYFDFDYRILHRNSCRIRCQMTSLRMQNLGPLGNAVQMWMGQGLMTREEALSLRGVRDPQAQLRQIEIEEFKATPEYKTAKLLSWMKQEEMTDDLPTVMYLLATKGGSGGAGAGGGGSPMGPMPGNGGPPPMAGQPGGPGQMGGAPMLPGPPPGLQGIV